MKPLAVAKFQSRVDPGLILTLLLTLFVVIPWLSNSSLPRGYDVHHHVYRAAEMNRSWRQGLFFPSWGEGFYWGYGSPVFHFYAKLTYYLTSLLHAILNLSAADSLLWLVALCLFACSGGMYLFCKRRSGRLGAVIAGLVYVYSPYLMYSDLYRRAAYPEFLSFALFPLVLWRADTLRDKPTPLNFLMLVLLQVALVNAHNLMGLLLPGITLAWIIYETAIQRLNRESSGLDWRDSAWALLAMALGFFAAASFWLPVFLESDSVRLDTSSFQHFSHFFLYADRLLGLPWAQNEFGSPLPSDKPSLGVAQYVLALTGLVFGAWLYLRGYRSRHPQTFLGITFFAPLAVALLLLIHPRSWGVWETLSPLQYLLFPWRLLGPIAASLAIVASLNGLWLSQLGARGQIGLVGLAVSLPIALVIPLLNPLNKVNVNPGESVSALHSARNSSTTAYHEFLPRDVNLRALPRANQLLMADYADGYPVDKLNRSTLPTEAEADLTRNSPQALEWHIKSNEAFNAEIYNFYWLGWRAEMDGRPLEISPSPHLGLITVALPAGEYSLRVYLGSTPVRDAAAAISALAIVIAGIATWRLRKSQPTQRPYWSASPLSIESVYGILLGGAFAIFSLILLASVTASPP